MAEMIRFISANLLCLLESRGAHQISTSLLEYGFKLDKERAEPK